MGKRTDSRRRHKKAHGHRDTPPKARESLGGPRPAVRKTLKDHWEPRFWAQADGRLAVVRRIKRRIARLKADVGADSVQKELLCECAAFISIQLETQAREAAEKGEFDQGRYIAMVNCFLGLIRSLGLEKSVAAAGGLKAYLANRDAG